MAKSELKWLKRPVRTKTARDRLRAALTIGLLGAYTTFSTLSYETYRLFEDGAVGLALANVLGSAAVGLVAVYLGVVAGRAV